MTQWILTSSLLILAVLLIRAIGRDKLSARVRYALWALVLLRLLIPGSLGTTSLSVLNYVPEREAVREVHQETELHKQPIRTVEKTDLPVISEITDTPDTFDLSDTSQTIQTDVAIRPSESTVQSETIGQTETTHMNLRLSMAIWVLGMALVGGMFVVSNLRFALMLRRSRQYFMTETVPVYVTEALETPCLFGVVRPTVYLTSEVAADDVALRHVLAHELTHYRHKDHIWSLLRCVCVSLHWYNPLVWVAAFVSQQDGELACDEGALQRIGEDARTAYARTLLDLTCVGYKGMLTTATSMTGGESSLKTRVMRIVQNPKMTVTALVAVLVIAALATVVLFTGAEEAVEFNGVWRSEVIRDDLGTEYHPYVFETYTQYELENGEGRRTVFRDGEVEQSVHFTYSVRGDKLTISVDKPPFWNPDFEPYKKMLLISGDTLIENADSEEEIVYSTCRVENPVFLSEGLFHVDSVQSWEPGGKERSADFEFDTYTAALLYLLRQAEVTVLEGEGKVSLNDPGYLWVLNGTNLRLADGVLYDDDNGYLLSNIKDIEFFLSAMPWKFTEPETDGYGMTYYNVMQEDVVCIKLTFSHGYREQRYYVPGNQSEWRDAIQEVYDNATTEWPDSFHGETLYDNSCIGFYISGVERSVYVYNGGVFSYSELVEHPDDYSYYAHYFATPEQAPKLSALMEYFVDLYEDSYAIGMQDATAYSGTWLLEEPVPEYGITDMILSVNAWYEDGMVYTIDYSDRFMAKQNGELIKSNMEVGVTGKDFLMLFRDGTEYKIPHTLQDGVLTLNINGTELRFRKGTVMLEDYMSMGDLVLVPRTGGQYYDAIQLEPEDKETFVNLVLKGLAAKEKTENIIVSNKNFHYLPIMAEVLDAQQVVLSDLGTIHFQGEAYRLTNWSEVMAFLDTVDLRYTKPVNLYPKG